MVVVAGTKSCRGKTTAYCPTLLMLGVGGQIVGFLVDVARGGVQAVLSPVGSDNGGRSTPHISPEGGNVEDGFQLALHGALFLRLYVVANLIGFCLHVVLLAVAEAIHGEIGLQRVLLIELVNTAGGEAQGLVAHLIVGAAGGGGGSGWSIGWNGGCLGAVGNLMVVVEAGVQGKAARGRVGELLADEVRAIARKQRGDGGLRLGVTALHILLSVGLIAVGAVVGIGGVGAEAILIDVEADALRQFPFARDAGVVLYAYELLGGLVGDDVDDTADGIGAIE